MIRVLRLLLLLESVPRSHQIPLLSLQNNFRVLNLANEQQDPQSKPKHDLSPCTAPPVSFSLRDRESISSHILPTIRRNFRENCVRGNGSFRMEGKFCANKTNMWVTLEDEPNAFSTCTTSESFPSSAPKSWDRTAMPALSSLCGKCMMKHQPGRKEWIYIRNIIHPA
jgi:hypothetical protein